MTGWVVLSCAVPRDRLGVARHRLEEWGALSLSVEEETAGSGKCRVVCDFPGETHPDALQAVLAEEITTFLDVSIVSYPRPGTGAGSCFSPFEIVAGVWVLPAWQPVSPGPRESGEKGEGILLDPGGVFGTGQHQTSALCAGFLEEILRTTPSPQRALDAGTGTGILALLAARLGVAEVLAVENDPGCLAVARANLARNPFARGRVRLICADLRALSFRAGGAFDLILANLLWSSLRALEPSLQGWLAPGGHLVLSGVTEVQAGEVWALYSGQGWTLRGRRVKSDWASLWLDRP